MDKGAANYQAILGDEDRVEIWRSGTLVTGGRWNGRAIVECWPPFDVPAVLRTLAAQLEAEISAAWNALPPACNSDGVDVSLIDWMLSLAPAERLAVLQDAADTFLLPENDGDTIP